MGLADIFGGDAFTTLSLTTAVNLVPFKPSRIGDMGLFQPQGVTKTTIVIEEKQGNLELLGTKPRGAPASVAERTVRTARSFAIPHIPHDSFVLADDVQNIRAFGSETADQTVAGVVNDRLEQMRQMHEVTHEHLRIGAIHGSILDSDGSTELFDLFTEFNVSETTVDFILATATTDIRAKTLAVIRAVEVALGAAPYDHIHAFCGKTWFEAFIGHALVKEAYDRFQDGVMLRNDPRAGFVFAGVTFEEYRGVVSGVDFIDASQARFFPVGVPNLFKMYYAPADFMETVNTVGLPIYAKQQVMDMDRGVQIHTQSNPLPLCHRPEVLIKGTTS